MFACAIVWLVVSWRQVRQLISATQIYDMAKWWPACRKSRTINGLFRFAHGVIEKARMLSIKWMSASFGKSGILTQSKRLGHAFITNMAIGGLTLPELQKLAGHKKYCRDNEVHSHGCIGCWRKRNQYYEQNSSYFRGWLAVQKVCQRVTCSTPEARSETVLRGVRALF